MLGEVLTAVVTPFGPTVPSRSIASGPCAATSSRTAPTASSSPGRPARRRRSPTTSGSRSTRSRVDEVGGDAHRRRRDGDLRHGALDAPDRARPRDRRGRLPRRDAVLQQAPAARHRRACRGDRGRHGSAGRLLRHPEPRRRRRRAGHDLGAGGDPERAGRQAGEAVARRGASRRRRRASISTRATTISSIRSSRSAASAASACTRTSSARR